MKRLMCLGFIVALIVASASPIVWAKPVSNQCSGDLVLNVTLKIDKSMDSGVAGNYWAYDFLNRHIQVRQVDESTYCAEVRDTGYFVTVAGRSPGATDDITDGIKGQFNGGYVVTIIGALQSEPAYDTFGNIGKFDYQCHPESGVCDSAFNWFDAYFSAGYTYDYVQWGWVYHTGKNGTWVNSSDGNSGDITD